MGDLSKITFKCPLNKNPVIHQKKLELITLSGYLTSNESHLHISVSDNNCNVFGGHLLPGTIVFKSLDILLGVMPNLKQQSIRSKNDSNVSVEVYILKDCPWSKRALKILDFYNIKYNYYLVSSDDEFKKVSDRTSINTFPQIFINNKFIGGYSELAQLSTTDNLIKLIN